MANPFSAPSAVRFRDVIETVPAYVAGRPAPVIDGLTTYKISSNENPYPPLPSVVEVLRSTAEHINRYPDMGNVDLRTALAQHYDYPVEGVAVGPGSTGALQQLMSCLAGTGDNIVFAWRSFEAYPILAALTGAEGRRVPLTPEGDHDLDAMAAAIDERTRLVLLCTPNNPTGPIITDAEARAFLARVPSDVAVIVDEAYVEFVRDPQAVDSFALQRDFPNVIVLRTFSKAYGLAGIRVGMSFAHPDITAAATKASLPFGVNLMAQAAAVASLKAQDELMARVDALVAERERLVEGLAAQGWQLPPTQANFVYFPLGEASVEFDRACEQQGLVVRRYGTEGVRVSIGETEANERFLKLASTLDSPLRRR